MIVIIVISFILLWYLSILLYLSLLSIEYYLSSLSPTYACRNSAYIYNYICLYVKIYIRKEHSFKKKISTKIEQKKKIGIINENLK